MNFKLTKANVHDCMRMLNKEFNDNTDILKESGEMVILIFADKDGHGCINLSGKNRDILAALTETAEFLLKELREGCGDVPDESELS